MTAVRRAAEWRGAILTAALLLATIVLLQTIGRGVVRHPEPAGFAITPSGSEVGRLVPIQVTYPHDAREAAPEALVRLTPAAPGTYTWVSARTLLFQPAFPGLVRGAAYTVEVAARPEAGLEHPATRTFTVAGKLVVQQVIPGDGDVEVPLGAQILVQFNRSVAPLTTLDARSAAVPIRFEPALHGTGEWLNTSIYRFAPTDLAPSTTYTLVVPKGLTSAADGALESDHTSTFTTVTPGVASFAPRDNTLFASPTQQVTVTFNQPIDRAAASAVSLTAEDGTAVAGTVAWSEGDTVATFTPSSRLVPGTRYTATVAAGVKGASRGLSTTAYSASFVTAPPPSIASTQPRDRQTGAERFGVTIQFATPMDTTTLGGKISISGFSAKDLEGRVNVSEQSVGVSVALEPATSYTVHWAAGALDRYGTPLGAAEFAFTTGDLPSSVSLALPSYSPTATYSASVEPVLYFQATNTPSVDFRLWSLDAKNGAALMHDVGGQSPFTPGGPPLRSWTETLDAKKNQVTLGATSLSGGGPLPRGYYFVRTSGQLRSMFAFAVVDTELVTKLSNDELLVWALDHDSGTPVPGATVHLTGPGLGASDLLTDASGLAHTSVPVPYAGISFDRSYYVELASGARFGVTSTRWSQGASAYQYGLPGEYYAREWVGQLYTDRPIYRPGETVRYKAIIRADDDAAYRVPSGDLPLELVLRNARGQELVREKLGLSPFGSYAGTFAIPADAPLGDYGITVEQTGGNARGLWVAGNSFLVAEFRAPEFQVTTAADRDAYVDGERITVRTDASYFFGGPVADATVEYTATAAPYLAPVPGFESYSFGDQDPWLTAVARDAVRAKGTVKTGPDGVATYAVPAVLNAAEGTQRFTLSATITDANGQAVAGSTQVTVHPAAVRAGIRAEGYVATQGRPTSIGLATVDTAGATVGGVAVAVRVYQREWVTTKVELPGGGRTYRSEARDTLLATLDATTGADGTGSVAYTPDRSAVLRLVAEVRDGAGRLARAATYVWVAGEGFALWQVTNDDTIKLVADKPRYEVGDTAEVLVPAPFAGATGLVTVERGKIQTREVRTFATNSETLRIPIPDRAVPDVFVSVVLYRPPTESDPVPRYKVGYAQLPVSTASRVLNVAITPDRAQAKPGDTVHYDIRVTDTAGHPVRAELSVAVVDKAVLALQDERGPDGLHAFWFERGLAVSTASSLSVSLDRWNDVIAEIARQGKGGAGGLLTGRDDARKDFRNTAYWDAQLVTDAGGRAGVDVVMPDNLTTWRMAARAISGGTMVGEGTNELVSTKPLLLRPALPRFVRVGDRLWLRALLNDQTAASTTATVTVAAEGLELGDSAPRTVTIAAGGTASVSWPAVVTDEGTVRVTFTASGGGGLSDAVTLTLPAVLDVTPETVSTGGVVTDQSQIEAVYLPAYAETRHGSLRVAVSSALVGSLRDELSFFDPRPVEGAEYVASRLIATLAVRRAEDSGGTKTTAYDGRIASDVAGLIGRQRGDGGWAWCDDPYCATDPNVTAWVLLALGQAAEDGTTLGLDVTKRASDYVRAYVNAPSDAAHPSSLDQKALLLAGLGWASTQEEARVPSMALFEQHRAVLSSWGRAYLLLALAESGQAAGEAVRALRNDLAASSIPSASGNHWEDAAERRGPFMDSTATTALVTLALSRTAPDHALLPQTVRWLVVARSTGEWRTSIDRALAMAALSAYAASTGELGGTFQYRVTLDDQEILGGPVRPDRPAAAEKTVPLTDLELGGVDRIAFERDLGGPGRLYYTIDLRYATPAHEIEALNRGFAVSHTYTLLDRPDAPVTSAKLGDVVRVTMTIVAGADHDYVTVEDLLPAGLEAVDARLANVDPALRARLEEERRRAAEKQEGTFIAPWYRWYYSPWQSVELRDDRTVLRAERLPKGVYEYVYYARATTVGDFFVAPAHAEEGYFPEVFGRSDSARFAVAE